MKRINECAPDASLSPQDTGDELAAVTREIVRAIRTVGYGSVEIVIRNSRVVQIERKEKFRFE